MEEMQNSTDRGDRRVGANRIPDESEVGRICDQLPIEGASWRELGNAPNRRLVDFATYFRLEAPRSQGMWMAKVDATHNDTAQEPGTKRDA